MEAIDRKLTGAIVPVMNYFTKIEQSVFKLEELQEVLREHASEWKLSKVPFRRFLEFVEATLELRREEIRSATYSPISRYTWGKASDYAVACSLRPRAYLSHGTAASLHGLNDQLPSTIYVNQEQSKKPPSKRGLQQERLDIAFKREQRTSKYVYNRGQRQIVLLAGKNTGRLAVESMLLGEKEHVDVTGVARTLIDIVVRPTYAGGIFQVLEAFKGAKEYASVEEISRLLRELDYVYPYHQAIGFLLERAGFQPDKLDSFRKLGLDFDFYITHGLKNPEYDRSWRLFIPQGL